MDNRIRTYKKHNIGKQAFRKLASRYGMEVVDVSKMSSGLARKNITYKAFVHPGSCIALPKNKTLYLTFRADSAIRKSGNVFFEISHTRKNGAYDEGWFFTCDADYIVYYDQVQDIADVIDWKQARTMIGCGQVGKIESIENDGDECITKVCLATRDELKEKGLLICTIGDKPKKIA